MARLQTFASNRWAHHMALLLLSMLSQAWARDQQISSEVITSGAQVDLEAPSGKLAFFDDIREDSDSRSFLDRFMTIETRRGGELTSGDEVFLKGPSGKYLEVSGTEVLARETGQNAVDALIIQAEHGGPIHGGDTVFFQAKSGKFLEVEGSNIAAGPPERSLRQGFVINVPHLRAKPPAIRELGEAPAKGGRPQDVMFFLFNALVIGTAVLHVSVLPVFRGLQYTVVLFVLGVIYALLYEGARWKQGLGPLGDSFDMWMGIKPQLILFTMLPVLLTADAMTIDTSVARKVKWQCFWLAGPIVLMNAFLTALFLWAYLPYRWDFILALTVGAIYAATDPVAVVALLKELGASPTLTGQIEGEALLNDGSAMVVYLVAYDILKGAQFGIGDVAIEMAKLALAASALGMTLGRFFAFWIQLASDRAGSNSGLIQISLTVCCAYWAFIIAEGVFHISGVLCTIFAAVVLADTIWPDIVDRESLEHVWHTLEHFGNTVIFFLSGAITGNVAVSVSGMDYLHVFVIYLAVVVIRFILVFGSIPVLNRLHPNGKKVTLADAAVMSWGGLRGALGLTLALQVYIEKGGGELDEMTAKRVLFYVGGIAALTLIINAPTSPALVRRLGITKTPKTGLRIIGAVRAQLEKFVGEDHDLTSQAVLSMTVKDVGDHIEKDGPERKAMQVKLPSGQELAERLTLAKNARESLPKAAQLLPDLAQLTEMEESSLVRVASADLENVHCEQLRAWSRVFLQLVRCEYWKLIDAGELNHKQAEMVLHSVASGIEESHMGLSDLLALKKFVGRRYPKWAEWQQAHEEAAAAAGKAAAHMANGVDPSHSVAAPGPPPRASIKSIAPVGWRQKLRRVISSLPMEVVFTALVVINTAFILIEDEHKKEAEEMVANEHLWPAWMIVFLAFLILESLLKLMAYGIEYFYDGWNLMDIVFIGLGVASVVLQSKISNGAKEVHELAAEIWQIQLLRCLHCFRAIRIMQQMRLGKLYLQLKGRLQRREVSLELAEGLDIITLFSAFCKVHGQAQTEILKFAGSEGRARSVELARCLLESRAQVYQAEVLALREAELVDPQVLSQKHTIQKCVRAVGQMSEFVVEANSSGVLTSREADALLHTLRERMKSLNKELMDLHEGLLPDEKLEKADSVHRLSMAIRSMSLGAVSSDMLDAVRVEEFGDPPPMVSSPSPMEHNEDQKAQKPQVVVVRCRTSSEQAHGDPCQLPGCVE